jgi:hypothetical protein
LITLAKRWIRKSVKAILSAAKDDSPKIGPKTAMHFQVLLVVRHKRAIKGKIWAGDVYYLVNS